MQPASTPAHATDADPASCLGGCGGDSGGGCADDHRAADHPAAAARSLARTPEAMAAISVGIGAIAALGGLRLALVADTPVGPSIVVVACAAFALTRLLGLRPGWR